MHLTRSPERQHAMNRLIFLCRNQIRDRSIEALVATNLHRVIA